MTPETQTIDAEITALRPREAANIQAALEAFKTDIVAGEQILDLIPENNDQLENGSTLAKRLKKVAAELDRLRKQANQEHRNSIAHNDGRVNPVVRTVEDMVSTIRANNKVYTDERLRLEQVAQEQAQRIEDGRRKAQETRAAKGMDTKPVEDLAPVPQQPAFKTTTSVTMKTHWMFEVTDYDKIPEEFKKEGWRAASLDGNKIRATQGKIEVPGIRVSSEQRPY